LLSVAEHWLSEAARLAPELAVLRPGLPAAVADSPSAGARLVEGLRQVLVALLQGGAPGVLFLDDLQWADEISLDLVSHVLRRLREHPLLVLATWRGEEVPAAHRLRQLVADDRRAGEATTLVLPRLEPGDVAELVSAVVAGADRDPDLAAKLYERTEGLSIFLIAYLEAVAEGTQPLDVVPGGIHDLLRARVGM
jgi:predicted ATPase